MAWPRPTQLREFYGNPDVNGDGTPDRVWEGANLTTFRPPYRMVLAWDKTREVERIRCHRLVADDLKAILTEIFALYSNSQAEIEKARLHLYGGCFNFRLMRGGVKLSVHSYGAAIDLDPEGNPLGAAWNAKKKMMPLPVVEIFRKHGWKWGGDWTRPDCQHFEAVRY